MSREEAINILIKDRIDTNLISDGYHTFGELYEHRIENFITICRMIQTYRHLDRIPVWMAKRHHDGTELEGWFILGIYTEPGKQITYHLPMSRWTECYDFATAFDLAPEWDKHTANDVLLRLKKL